MEKKCVFKGCFKKAHSKGLCIAHYQQQRTGKKLKPLQFQVHGKTEKERFFARIGKLESGCWQWLGSLNAGYGQFRLDTGAIILSHRYSYLLHKGGSIEGLVVMHTCDNPKCVNPDHLVLGTQADNVQDMHKKGRDKKRALIGINHSLSKLNDEAVREIRKSSDSIMSIAKRFDVSRASIYDVLSGKTWKHVK